MELREYQNNAINSLKQAFTQGFKSPVLVLACGGGKSIITAHIAKAATDKGNSVLFMVHLREILQQIEETFINYGVNMTLCDISMTKTAHKLNKKYDIIITDESHHAVCNTYTKIYNLHPDALRVNVTATPCRTDGRGLGETCDKIINTVSVKWLIKNNYLAPYEYYSVTLDSFKFNELKKKYGEYEDITELLDKPKIYGDILKQYKNGSKVICYCSSIEHSIKVANMFNSKGIKASHIDGKTPKNEREQIINDFRTGEIKILCNYSLISEGFDVPDCDSVFLLKKTTSLNLFIQMAMRCMRYKKNKTAYIYDFCGNCYEHGLPCDDREWSLNSKTTINKNLKSEPDILCRQCSRCFRVYAGNNRICTYCGNDNGKTKQQIETEEKAELTRIEKINKKQKIEDLKEARKTLEGLKAYGIKHGYKAGWAYTQWQIINKYRRKYERK